jgi:hypothetical protein
VLAVWSAGEDNAFTARLERTGFKVEVCRGHKAPKQRRHSRHVVWLATPQAEPERSAPHVKAAAVHARPQRPAPARSAHGRRPR